MKKWNQITFYVKSHFQNISNIYVNCWCEISICGPFVVQVKSLMRLCLTFLFETIHPTGHYARPRLFLYPDLTASSLTPANRRTANVFQPVGCRILCVFFASKSSANLGWPARYKEPQNMSEFALFLILSLLPTLPTTG